VERLKKQYLNYLFEVSKYLITGMWLELAKAANILVRDMLKVKEGENVLIYGDTSSDEAVLKAVAEAVHVAGATPVVVVFETKPEVDMPPPKPLAAAMKQADVIVEFAKMYLIHTEAYREALKAGARAMCLSGIDTGSLVRCIGRVYYPYMVALGDKLSNLVAKGNKMRITNSSGTDISFENGGRKIFHFTGVAEKPGTSYMLGGQVGWCPLEDTINGTLVIDGSIWPPAELGLLKAPVTLTVKEGKIKKIEGGAEARIFEKWLKSFNDPHMFNIAHICFGINPGARLTGNITEDERVFGAIVWGIGDQVDEIGGKAGHAKAHTDGVMLTPSVWIDEVLIEKDGEFIHPELSELARRTYMKG
jgi:2,5-dihydroxypyridine 5,6-dioxygenase